MNNNEVNGMGIKKKVIFLVQCMAFIQFSTLLTACGGGAESASVPIILDAPIAYVKRPVQFDMNGDLVPIDVTDPVAFHPGGDLYLRGSATSAAEEVNVTRRFTGGMGDVKDVEFSPDGTKVIFAMRAPDLPNTQPEDQPKWDIWEYGIASDTLSRVMPVSVAQEHQDVSPAYLANGQIIYTSTRQQDNQAILGNEGKSAFAGLTENRQQKALVLHRMNPDGSVPPNPQISFNQSHDLDPIVLSNGRILFSRWDNMGGGQGAINLYTINPDGTEFNIVYGAHSHDTGSGNSTIQFLKTSELDNGNILALLAPINGQSGGGMLVSIDINTYIDNTTSVIGNLVGPAQTNVVNTTILTDGNPSPGGLYSTAYPLNDGTSRYLVSWTPCRLQDPGDGTILPCSSDNLANPALVEAPPLFGLFMYDASANTQVPVVVPKEGIIYTDAAAASPRPEPNSIPDKAIGTGPFDLNSALIAEEVGIININSVYEVDGTDIAPGGIATVSNPLDANFDQRPARFLRVVKGVSIPGNRDLDGNDNTSLDNDAFGVGANAMREIIGYAPIEPDGSVKIKVPANVPLSFDILGKDGKRTPMFGRHDNWIQVRKGDTLNCVGCHDHSSNLAHARPGAPAKIYSGNSGLFPNTDISLTPGSPPVAETMAERRTRIDGTALELTVDLIGYDDFWTNPIVPRHSTETNIAGIRTDADTVALYRDLPISIVAPATTACQDKWQTTFPPCRVAIHYETQIHPIWSVDRGGVQCITCHTTANFAITQLDLTDGLSDLGDQNHYKAYRELLSTDNEVNAMGDVIIGYTDRLDPDTGLPVIDPTTNPPTPFQDPVFNELNPPIVAGDATASGQFFDRFTNPANTTHNGLLNEAELKLLIEWVDIGAQYYNTTKLAPAGPVDANRFVN